MLWDQSVHLQLRMRKIFIVNEHYNLTPNFLNKKLNSFTIHSSLKNNKQKIPEKELLHNKIDQM